MGQGQPDRVAVQAAKVQREAGENGKDPAGDPHGDAEQHQQSVGGHHRGVALGRGCEGPVAQVQSRQNPAPQQGRQNPVLPLRLEGGEKYENVAAVFCSGQGGDQGTRAIINNLYSGTFTNPEHTAYTADSEQNIKALELLKSLDGVNFDASINGGEEINLFRQGVLQMAFCWNIGAQNNVDAGNEPGKTNNGEEIVCMAFPTDDGKAELCGGIWGFGIFDNGDAAKIEAAKKFVKFMGDGEGTAEAVKASTYFAVRDTAEGNDLTKIYADNPVMTEYTKLMPMLGDYYQVVPGWAEARTAWWNMLQKIGSGTDVAEAVAEFVKTANAAAGA